jgi:hypothetical protein
MGKNQFRKFNPITNSHPKLLSPSMNWPNKLRIISQLHVKSSKWTTNFPSNKGVIVFVSSFWGKNINFRILDKHEPPALHMYLSKHTEANNRRKGCKLWRITIKCTYSCTTEEGRSNMFLHHACLNNSKSTKYVLNIRQ